MAGKISIEKNLGVRLSIFFVLFSIVPLALTQAQTILPRAGITISTHAGEVEPQQKINSATSMVVGAGLEFPLKKQLAILTEIDFIIKGHNFYSKEPNIIHPSYSDITSITYKQNFLEVPVMIKEYFGKEKLRFYINGGIYGAVGLGGTKKGYEGTYVNGNTLDYEEYDGKIKYGTNPDYPDRNDVYYDSRWDAGAILGVGTVLFERFALDVRYEWGWANKKYKTLQVVFSMPLNLKNPKE